MSTTEQSAFKRWRRARPFWGGLLLTLGGGEIFLTVKAPLPVIMHVGMGGLAGYLVPVLILICGVLVLFNPAQRLFYSLVGAALGLGSWITSNLGGFFVGLLLTLVGSALVFAWSPHKSPGTTPPVAQEPPAEPQPQPSLDELLNRPQQQ
jgi:hypothetical protein